MTSGDPSALLAALSGTPVLVVGDVMLDRFVHGRVERISPEGPIPVLAVERDETMLGGAGNVLRNLTALDVPGRLVALVGDDDNARELAGLVAAERLAESDLITEKARQTTVKLRYIAGGQHLLRADREAKQAATPVSLEALAAAAKAGLSKVKGLIVSDYGKGVLAESVLRVLIDGARTAGLPVVVDPKGPDFGRYRGASVITPNRRELAEAAGRPLDDLDALVAAGGDLMAAHDLGALLVTRSEEGMTLLQAREGGTESAGTGNAGTGNAGTGNGVLVRHFPALTQEVYDVSGAGDTVAAVIGAALAAGLALSDAAALANVAAGVVVGKVGTATLRPADLLAACHGRDLLDAESGKLADLESLLEVVARWRRQGLKVGFTNGCFDLLHPGHVSLLRQARAACDRLIVGLNSDGSIKRLKGEGRPVQTEASRAAVLASLATVDRLVIFSEDTPLALIEALKPDILVKGADYKPEEVVGGDVVERAGGRVLLADLEPGHSTSATLARLTDGR